jgi:hypothetical protein
VKVIDKEKGIVEVSAQRKAFEISIDKDGLLPGVYALGGPSFEAEQEMHGLAAVRPWQIKSTTAAETLKEEFPVQQQATPPAAEPAKN